MKQYLIIITLLFSLSVNAQEKLLFDSARIDNRTQLIGRYAQYDKDKTYQSLNFVIDDSATIQQVLATLSHGKEQQNQVMVQAYSIALVQDFKEVRFWTIYPDLRAALYDGHSYAFDIKVVKALAKKYPFQYRFDKVPFADKPAFDVYLNQAKQNNNFLFDYEPAFAYAGSFDIQFPNNTTFTSPKAVSDYLRPEIEKIVAKGEYRVIYLLSDKNLRDQSQYTMSVSGSRYLYDHLQLPNLQKQEWKPMVNTGWFFYRVK